MAKFKPGQMVQARNGRGSVYMINRIIPAQYHGETLIAPERYEFDNGSVDIRKRARSGAHTVERADRGYKVVG